MTSDIAFVFLLIAIAGALMASNRVRYDAVALLVVLALILGDVLSVGEAFAGFGSTVVILVACLLVVGEMLDRTGVARAVGDLILKHGGQSETKLLVLIMVSAALLGSIMSSTAVVAIFIPIVLRIAADTGHDKARLLLPMSYAALISGMLTLIATTPNLVVSDELVAQGFEPLGFFSFFPIGVAALAVAIVHVLFWGRFQLASPTGTQDDGRSGAQAASLHDLWVRFGMLETSRVVDVTSPLQVTEKAALREGSCRIVARGRSDSTGHMTLVPFRSGMDVLQGDRLLLSGARDELLGLDRLGAIRFVSPETYSPDRWIGQFGIAEVMVHPEGEIVGKPAVHALEEWASDLALLGILRNGESLSPPFDTTLQAGDLLLVAGTWTSIDARVARHDTLVLLQEPRERVETTKVVGKFTTALAILAAMVGVTLLGLVSITVAVVLAAMAAVLFRTLSADEAYSSVSLSSLVLIAGMLPLADALYQTGGSDLIVDVLLDVVGEADPRAMMAALFLLTALLGLVLSNTASAVLVAPIAISAAEALAISPYPLAICVLFGASAAFSTPISTPVVTLVVTPGGYRFADFLKIGIPLTFLIGAVAVALAPVLFPY